MRKHLRVLTSNLVRGRTLSRWPHGISGLAQTGTWRSWYTPSQYLANQKRRDRIGPERRWFGKM